MLRNEGFQNFHFQSDGIGAYVIFESLVEHGMAVFHMRGKIRPIAQMAATSHHGQIDASSAPLNLHGQYIDIGVRHSINRLLMQHARQGRHLIANLCGQFKFKLVGMCHHARLHGL